MATREWNYSPAGEEDAEAMVRLTTRTLAAEPQTITKYKDIPSFAYPKERQHLTPPEQLFAHRVQTRKKAITSEGICTYKVMHPSEPGRMIGAVMCKEPVEESPKTLPLSDEDANKLTLPPSPPAAPPACLDLEAMKHVQETMETARREIWGSNGSDADSSQPGYLFDPEFRRQGIATQLMQPLFKQPEYIAGRLPIYVEASPLGKMFSQSCGFEVLRDVELFEGRAMLSAMILRRPADA
ncbi:hypothetical protein TI39_contig298g00001 [Zymoseptoria brevis]|uniref:N-acetyltransferase domain-containing protein n=1 Tax=Zymoseptoria brevis TaxID=1047168 RepID=A0A0F4GV22_9PEZI|nr:hypothetical protein TI39_contig298g00001 [Zymoseptoria brevis]